MIIIPTLGADLTKRALETYTLDEIKADPYILMHIEGIAFGRADRVARAFGIKEDDPRRTNAITAKLLELNTSFGHSYIPKANFLRMAAKSGVVVDEDRLASNPLITIDGDAVYPTPLYRKEVFIANELVRRKRTAPFPPIDDIEEIPNDRYQNLFMQLFSQPHPSVIVLTGGPGTGKTYVTARLIQTLARSNKSFICVAPTGKAAQRLSEVSKYPASTIHRALKLPFGNNRKRDERYVIIDESSMVDLALAFHVFRAWPDSCLVFIGDQNQLASVGPGNFYRDLISTGLFPVVRLLTNHRQGEGSLIAENAMRINLGSLKLVFDESGFRFVEASNPLDIRAKVLELAQTLHDNYGECQILTPQHKTVIGVDELNRLAKIMFNPGKHNRFDVGDRVIQMTNNYKAGVFNGYVGKILDLPSNKHAIVDFYGSAITVPVSELSLGWAATIHKFQGSEFDAGIIILSSAHTFMLTRNLLYTAITRAKKNCVIVGDKIALKRAIVNNREQARWSKLVERALNNLGTQTRTCIQANENNTNRNSN